MSNAEAEQAMREFAQVTGTDEIFAQTILQDVNWKLDVSSLPSDHIEQALVSESARCLLQSSRWQ